jgi:uncharacterized protein (TIGR02646 family)
VRFIRKMAELRKLSDFKRKNRDTPQVLRYSNLTFAVIRTLHKSLLAEQGSLCAYTMMPIGRPAKFGDANDFHIEHIRPQSRNTERDLDYDNLLLCTPGPGAEGCDYGARQKADAEVDDKNFVSPLSPGCETRLNYRLTGKVHAMIDVDYAARRTVDLLKLNHPNLIEARIEALRSHGLASDAKRPISAAQASRLARIIKEADSKGRIAPFCITIKQVAERFAQKQKARAARIAHSAKE